MHANANSGKLKVNAFREGFVKSGCGHLVQKTLKSAVSKKKKKKKKEFMNGADFVHADCDAIIFF